MSIRDDLYSAFENYDKPNQEDFALLIDTAAKPSYFKELIIPNTSDIITDINTITIVLEIRNVKLIKHGVQVYIFAELEGTYGLGGVPITPDMLAYVGEIGAQGLTKDLTSEFNVGGIKLNQFFPAGTSFEDLFIALLTSTTLSGLSYESSPQTNLLVLNEVINITKFKWNITGDPQNMQLFDNKSIYNETVTGVEQIVNLFYNYSTPTTVRWTLDSPGVGTSITEAHWVLPYYWNKNVTVNVPDEAEILASFNKLERITNSVTADLNTADIEYGWVAVSSDFNFTRWWVDELNNAELSDNGFMRNAGVVQVNGYNYTVYIYNYSSDLTKLTLL
jgi:hypothetical protein